MGDTAVALVAPVCQSPTVANGAVQAQELGQLTYHRTPAETETFAGFVDRMIKEKELVDKPASGSKLRSFTIQLSYYQDNGQLKSVVFKLSEGNLACAREQAQTMDQSYQSKAIDKLHSLDEVALREDLAALNLRRQGIRTGSQRGALASAALLTAPAAVLSLLFATGKIEMGSKGGQIGMAAGQGAFALASGGLFAYLAFSDYVLTDVNQSISNLEGILRQHSANSAAPAATPSALVAGVSGSF